MLTRGFGIGETLICGRSDSCFVLHGLALGEGQMRKF